MRIIAPLIASLIATNAQAEIWTASPLLSNCRMRLVTIKHGERYCGPLVP